jgi:hypothetical protein
MDTLLHLNADEVQSMKERNSSLEMLARGARDGWLPIDLWR